VALPSPYLDVLTKCGCRSKHPKALDERTPRCQTSLFQIPSAACRPLAGIPIQEQVVTAYKDQIQGRIKEVQGKIKEVAGKLVGNKELQAKGMAQKTRGKAQAKFGDVKQKLKVIKKKATKKKAAIKKAVTKKAAKKK
jgi:uncharacterized protein YjbJ (UPF0337 family)